MMDLYSQLVSKEVKLSVIGLGYVGLVLAVKFAEKLDVVGFDINKEKIANYLNGKDSTDEIGSAGLRNTTMHFTSNEADLKKAKFHIIAVPTPITKDNTPDLHPLIKASQTVGRNLTPGSVVVYESTVFPGVTEDICIPILENESHLKCGLDFKIGYSPERVNPGDKLHTVDKIIKIVSGIDAESLELIAKVYSLIITAGVYRSKNIKIAEAAKVIENTQRDINIAFINELSLIFEKMDIDTTEVLQAASTKWNFMPFSPGLVGGHCIGVDPYYLTYKSQQLGYTPEVILAGRKINNRMGKYIGEKTVKSLIKAGKQIKDAKVAVLGITFKENCPDIRNSKVIDIIDELNEYGIQVFAADPIADPAEVKKEYNIALVPYGALKEMDAVVIAVCHEQYKTLSLESLKSLYTKECAALPCSHILLDVKGIFTKETAQKAGYLYWRL